MKMTTQWSSNRTLPRADKLTPLLRGALRRDARASLPGSPGWVTTEQRRPFISQETLNVSTAVAESAPFTDYYVADIRLADWGRREIAIAETEMPGLMAIR